MPPSNAYLSAAQLPDPEPAYPLRLFVCDHCWLVQTEDFTSADALFTPDYAYFSSVSKSWLAHAEAYVEMIIPRLALDEMSLVVEVAANDGYLLKHVVARGIPCLGIEPTASTAEAAERLGIPILKAFFGQQLARALVAAGQQADLIVGNNVFAHVPDINDFSRGLAALLKPGGTVTLEFPHLLNLVEQCQFDTVYHEHFSYLSLHSARRILQRAGLQVIDVERLDTHGGSLRVYAARRGQAPAAAVDRLLEEEQRAGLETLAPYASFQARVDRVRDALAAFLKRCRDSGTRVVAYGAAAKGNTLLNYAGVTPDLLPVVYDAAPSKQGKYLPGSHIPIRATTELDRDPPDVVLILPWNIRAELEAQLAHLASRGTQFVDASSLPEEVAIQR